MSKITRRFDPAKLARKIKFKVEGRYKDKVREFAESLGNYPFIWYNSYPIEYMDISFFELSIVDNIPNLKIIFKDGLNMMRDKGFPLDDSIITVFLNPRTRQLKPIHLDFKIIDFQIIDTTCVCHGVIDVYKLFVKEFKSYKNKTSFKVLQDLCKDTSLGFYSNFEDSDDQMTWINSGNKIYHFMTNILDNVYLSDQSFVMGYVDYYYNYNLIDIQKELSRNLEEESSVINTGVEEIAKSENRDVLGKLYLTSEVGFENTNFYFESYTIINRSTSISIDKGYQTFVQFYDPLKKELPAFRVDSIVEQARDKIILKGFPKENKFKNENIEYYYAGKIDTDNAHKNFNYARVLNDRNLFDLEKIAIEITLGNPNFNLYRFLKISVIISNNVGNANHYYNNQRLSGEWLITDIKFRFENARLTQVVTLVKRELEIGPQEKANLNR